MRLYMRNKTTGEIKDVEADSGEFYELQKQVTGGGQPMWEQTSFHHAAGIQKRAEDDDLSEFDLGHKDQDDLRYAALELANQGVSPEQNPHLVLTPAEVNEGLTPESKLEGLQKMYEANREGTRANIFSKAARKVASKPKSSNKESSSSPGGTSSGTPAEAKK